MMTEFVEVPGGQYLVEGHDHNPTTLRADWTAFVGTWPGVDPWEAEEIASKTTFGRTWYTDAGGFTHDCSLHAPDDPTLTGACEGSRPVIAVGGLSRAEIQKRYGDGA